MKLGVGQLSKFGFKVSLRVFHPTWPADDIIAHFGRRPKIANSVGEQRKTSKGANLDGRYSRTYVSFELEVAQEAGLEEFLKSELASPMLADTAYLETCTSTGGEVEFFVGVFLTGDSCITLPPELTEALSRKKLTLKLDIYPWPAAYVGNASIASL
jgi:hypothetical protein